MVIEVQRAYRFRFYPTKEQEDLLAKTFGCCRWLYNHFLNLKQETWKNEKKSLSYNDCSAILPSLKEEYPWLKEVSSVPLQQSLRHLDNAYQNFFKKLARYPVFKKRRDTQAATFTKSAFKYEEGTLQLAKLKDALDVRWSQSFSGEVSSLTVTKDSIGRYHVSFHMKEMVQCFPFVKKEIGLDLGLRRIVQDNDGRSTANPHVLKKRIKKVKRAHKALSRKQKGSKNKEKARENLARQYAKVKDKRDDFLHKLSSQLVRENQVIAVESLKVKNMIKNKRLSRLIADIGWGTLVRFLEYKCKWYGKMFVKIDTFFPSSKRCSECDHTLEELSLNTRQWECPKCHTCHDRDTNAAKNILKEGMRLLAEEYRGAHGN